MPAQRLSQFFKSVYLLLAATLGLFFYSLFGRPIHVDTAILGEPTYWLYKEGVLRSELQRGWQHAEEHFFFTHKLFLHIGAWWCQIFGWSLTSLNSISLAYFALLLGVWALIARSQRWEWRWFSVFALLLLTNHQVYELCYVYRPEIAVAAFSACTYFLVNRYLLKKNFWDVILAAVVAGFGIGHHLNGVIIVVAGFVLLLSRRQWTAAVVFAALGSLGMGYYLLDIRSWSDFQWMISQFQNMQDIQAEHRSWSHYLFNLPEEQKRFLHSPVEIGFTLLIIPLFIFNWRDLLQTQRNMVIFGLAGIVSLALISHDKDTKYLTLHIPLLTFLAVHCLRHIMTVEIPTRQFFRARLLPLFIVLFFIGQWRSNGPLTFNKEKRLQNYAKVVGPPFASGNANFGTRVCGVLGLAPASALAILHDLPSFGFAQ